MAGGRADGWARGQAGERTGSERLMGERAVEWSGILGRLAGGGWAGGQPGTLAGGQRANGRTYGRTNG